jgi:hypothetical protein
MPETSQGNTATVEAPEKQTGTSGKLPPVETSDIKPPAPDKAEASPKDSKSTKAPAKEKGPGPWQAELEKRGLNSPEMDQYMREILQPYITQLEQGAGGGDEYGQLFGGDMERAQMAAELMQAFLDDPQAAYKELGEILEIAPGEAPPPGAEAPADPNDMPPPPNPLDDDPRIKWVEEERQRQQEAQEDAEYDELMTQLGDRVPGFNPEAFNLAVLAAQGDMDQAFKHYMEYMHKEPSPSPESPPPALAGQGGTAPPAEFQGNIKDAVDSTFAEMKAARGR